jgi:hypothetical protein
MNTNPSGVNPTEAENASAETTGDVFTANIKKMQRADRRRRWLEAYTEVDAMMDWLRGRGASEGSLKSFRDALDANLAERPTPQFGRARGEERIRWAAVPDDAVRAAHAAMNSQHAQSLGGILQELLYVRADERRKDRLVMRSKSAVDDLGSVRNHEDATEKGVQHALITALEMVLGRKVHLGERLAEAENLEFELLPSPEARRAAGLPRLYEPSYDVEAINVLDQPLPLLASDQTKTLTLGANVTAALPETQQMVLEAGEEMPALGLGRGPNDLVTQALERETRVRQQIFELGDKLRAKGALPDDVNAFVNGLGALANEQKAEKITPELIQATFDQLPRGYQTRLAGPLESVIQRPVTNDTQAARTPEMARAAGISLPDLLSCLESSGAHVLDTYAFSKMAPDTGEPMQLNDITRILDRLDPDQTARLVEAFNLAAEKLDSPISKLVEITDMVKRPEILEILAACRT